MTDGRSSTRRDVLQVGAAAGIAAAAGCLSTGDSDDEEVTHTVTMPPVGEVEFTGVPEV